MKTGQLIVASLETGALLAEADTATSKALTQYGINLGLAFQVTDDILNVTGDAKIMGKSVKSDASHDKVTFPELLGVDGSNAYAQERIQKAKVCPVQPRSACLVPSRDSQIMYSPGNPDQLRSKGIDPPFISCYFLARI